MVSYNTTAQDLAARYGVTDRHITNLARRGDIPGVRLGTEWRFNAVEVHEALVLRSRTVIESKKLEHP